jgi:hypothetical protein
MSMSKFIPVGTWMEPPSIGAKSPPQVDGSDQALTYVKVFPCKATFPTPVMNTTIDAAGSPGLDPELHLISVAVAAVIAQAIPSITIEISACDEVNPVPVKVISVPPVTDPYLGEITVTFGVEEPVY